MKNSNCDETKKSKWLKKNKTKTQMVTKLKNPNCDKTQKVKL